MHNMNLIRHRANDVIFASECINKFGYKGVEIDVRCSDCGELIVQHDEQAEHLPMSLGYFLRMLRMLSEDRHVGVILDIKGHGVVEKLRYLKCPEKMHITIMGFPGMEVEKALLLRRDKSFVLAGRYSEYESQSGWEDVAYIDSFNNNPEPILERFNDITRPKIMVLVGPDLRDEAKSYTSLLRTSILSKAVYMLTKQLPSEVSSETYYI